MTDTSTNIAKVSSLTGLITAAAAALTRATTSAEVLDVIQLTTVAYDAAKTTARLSKAKDAHDTIIAACHKVQADALAIEEQAQCRLANEYDAAQARGEVAGSGFKGNQWSVPDENAPRPSAKDVGLTRKEIHEARLIRDFEKQNPGGIKKILDEMLAAGQEPTRANLKRAITPKPVALAVEAPKFDPDAVKIGELYRDARDSLPETDDDDDKPWCHFCGKLSSELETLVEGEDYNDDGCVAYICDECVDTCVEIIEGKNGPTETNIGNGIAVIVENDTAMVRLTHEDGSSHTIVLDAASLRFMVDNLERGERVTLS